MYSFLLPSAPAPLAFASSTATSKAFFTDSPNVLTSPESGVIRPILISFAGGDLQPGKCPTRRTTSARSGNPLLTFLLLYGVGGVCPPILCTDSPAANRFLPEEPGKEDPIASRGSSNPTVPGAPLSPSFPSLVIREITPALPSATRMA